MHQNGVAMKIVLDASAASLCSYDHRDHSQTRRFPDI